MRKFNRLRLFLVLLAIVQFLPRGNLAIAAVDAGAGDDRYFRVPLAELTLIEGKLPPAVRPDNLQAASAQRQLRPYAVLDGAGEAYIVPENDAFRVWGPVPGVGNGVLV